MLSVTKKYVFSLSLILVAFGHSFAEWDGKMLKRPNQDAKGVFLINSEAELAWFADTTNYKLSGPNVTQMYKVSAKLEKDLDMSGGYFTPICGGNGDKKFQGVFDGNGHVISNISIDGEWLRKKYNDNNYGQNVGFVGAMSGGTVKDLIIENITIHSSTNMTGDERQISVGAIVGWQENGTIEDCVTSGSIFTSGNGQGVGGVVGALWKGTIKNCLSYVSIKASGNNAQIGGIIGLVKKKNDVKVESCAYAGTTLENTGNGQTGAILGQNKEGSTKLTVNNVFYTEGVAETGIGGKEDGDAYGAVDSFNDEETLCKLNRGKWSADDNSCSVTGGAWSSGETTASLNGYGADGYKITFSANGGTFNVGVKTVKYLAKGQKITADEIGIPEKANMAFAGWALTADALEASSDLGVVTGVTTIYAFWDPKYTINFSATPGAFPDGKGTKTIQVAKGKKIAIDGFEVPFSYESQNGTKYYFTGWALNENPQEGDTLHVLPNATNNMTLYAVWTEAVTYTVTYNDNGHGKTKVDYVRVEKKQKTDAPEDPEPDVGYNFGGWFTEATCQPANLFDFKNTEIEKNWVLYAKWTALTYDITYNLDGGTNNVENPSTYTVESETILLKDPTKEGFDFKGWFYDQAFTEKATQISQQSTGLKTLYAKWETKKFPVTYLAGTLGKGTVEPDTLVYGGSITLKGAGVFYYKGYKESAWIDADDNEYALGSTYTTPSPITLYPKWEIQSYTISYENTKGAVNNNKTSYTVKQNVNLTALSLDGYEFAGWYDNAEFTGEPVTKIATGSTGDTTFYAKWTKNLSTITVTAVSQVFEYDGKSHGAECEVEKDNSLEYTVTATSENTVQDVAEGEVSTSCNVVIMDGDIDITASYEGFIEKIPGTISVKAKETKYGAVTISTDENGASAIIDGTSEETVNITEKDNVVVKAITFNRTFPVNAEGENKMSTLVLPFSIAKSKVEGAEFYELNDVVGTKVRIWKSLDVLEANTPYIIRTTADHLTFNLEEDEKISFNTEKMNDSKSTDGLWTIHGVYSYKKWEEGDPELGRAYGYTAKATNNLSVGKFARNGAGAYIKPLRAYLLKASEEKSSKARRMLAKSYSSIVGESSPDEMDVEIVDRETGETTVIGKLNPATGEIRMIDGWFDMKGRKLNAKPTSKGIYYFNGKQVIVR